MTKSQSKPDTLTPNENWQTQSRGSNWDEYQIYLAQVQDLGLPIKSFDEWLNS